MTDLAYQRGEGRGPAFAAAVGLHIGMFLLIAHLAKPDLSLPLGTAVPINLVANAPTTDSRAAAAAPVAQTAQAEAPAQDAKALQPPPPAPSPPRPAPKTPAERVQEPALFAKPVPKVKPAATAKPSAAPPKPAPAAKPTPAKPFSLEALQADIAKSAHGPTARTAFAAKGPTRPETALAARLDAGKGVSQSDIAGLSQLLERLWNPNCSVEGGEAVIVPVRFSVGPDGRVLGRVSAEGREASADPIVSVAAYRAIDAVRRAEPYAAAYRGRGPIVVNFNARKACSQREG